MAKKAENEALKYYAPHIVEAVKISARENIPALLIGDTGTGKTHLINEIAKEGGVKLTRINLTGQTGVDDIVGRWIVTGGTMTWADGLLTRAMRSGNEWVVLDELNMALPEILAKLHSLLDEDAMLTLTEKDGEIVRPAPGFRLFGTMNPSGDYAGTKEMNRAFLSRFGIVAEVGTAHDEARMVAEFTGNDPESAVELVKIADELRTARKDGKISFAASTRDLLQASYLMVKGGMSMSQAVMFAIVGKAPTEEKKSVEKIVDVLVPSTMTKRTGRTLASYVTAAKNAATVEAERDALKTSVAELTDKAAKYEALRVKLSEAGVTL